MSRLSIELPEKLHRSLKAAASLQGLSLRDYVLRRLRKSPGDDEQVSTRFSESGLAELWADREDLADPAAWVREQRKPRILEPEKNAD